MSNASKGALSGAASGAASGAMIGGPWGAVIGGAIGGISGLMSGSAADDAEKLAETQAEFHLLSSKENLRRMRNESERIVGLANAKVYASNILMTGSTKRYVQNLDSEMRRQEAWEEGAARVEAAMIKKGGQVAADGIMTNMYADQIRQVGSAFASYYSPGNGYKYDSNEWDKAGIGYLEGEGII